MLPNAFRVFPPACGRNQGHIAGLDQHKIYCLCDIHHMRVALLQALVEKNMYRVAVDASEAQDRLFMRLAAAVLIYGSSAAAEALVRHFAFPIATCKGIQGDCLVYNPHS